MDGQTPTALSARPYRSHKIPACDKCRQRRIRCDIDLPGQPCRFCRLRHELCKYTEADRAGGTTHSHSSRPPKRRRQSHVRGDGGRTSVDLEATLSHFPSVAGTSPTQSSVMMNPTMAEDITILQKYLTSRVAEPDAAVKVYNTISDVPSNPIVYLTVPRRRKGYKPAIEPGRIQREIIEQILSPFSETVRKLYFDYLHPCFPVLDAKTFNEMWHKDNERISSTLICDLYASALHFWNKSEVLRHHPRPDLHFIWNQAVAALQDDFMAPSISTVHAGLLDMIGRPVIQVQGNIVTAGRLVTLAQSLGLNRDPTQWKATTHEKNVRIRLWWGVLIHDYWSSIGHGIPPTINARFYDVPLPTVEMLLASNILETHRKATTSFIHLCKLSQILGDILPIVYSLRINQDEAWRNLRKIECALDDWIEKLPDYLQQNSSPSAPRVDGASNLWFSYLSIKVLVCRLGFKATLEAEKSTTSEARQYRLALLRESASEVVDYVTTLNDNQLHEFWMPYTSYLLVSAATIFLRCTIECSNAEVKTACATKLLLFSNRLQRAYDDFGWDLAEFCLERCREPIRKIAEALKVSPPTIDEQLTVASEAGINAELRPTEDDPQISTDASSSVPDVFLPVDSLDFPWETLWNTSEGPWSIQI